uniref:Uncharacterized protein n=1 Tax=Solanum tuberosum TaxID=4113 RepID=M1B2M0_SOLTU
MNYSTVCISFIKYVIFPCFDIFYFIFLVYKCLSILELKGWQSPPSSRNWLVLKLADDQLDFPGICSFLQSSLDLETLVIDWFEDASRDLLLRYTNEDKQIRRFETHSCNGSFPHLKTVKIDNLRGN